MRNRLRWLQLAVIALVVLGIGVDLAFFQGSGATTQTNAVASAGPKTASNVGSTLDHALKLKQATVSAIPGDVTTAADQRREQLTQIANRIRKRNAHLRVARPVATFTMANFNLQGASHRGNVAGRTAGAIRLFNQYDVQVAAVQEFAPANRAAWDRQTGSAWARYPTAARSLDQEDSVVWRTKRFTFVKGFLQPLKYFGGSRRNMPWVLLRDRETGAAFWVTSFHNPATCCGHGNAAGFRAFNVAREAEQANEINDAKKYALLVAGDMNDRAAYYCSMGGRTGMHSADGSNHDSGCSVPRGSWIDWILGNHLVEFSSYRRDRGGTARASSDHPIIVTDVTLKGAPGDGLKADRTLR